MSAPPPAVMARLGCARLVLLRGRDSRSDEDHEMLSKTQVDAILAEIKGQTPPLKSMSPEAAARVSSLASSVPFAPGHLSHVLKHFDPIDVK